MVEVFAIMVALSVGAALIIALSLWRGFVLSYLWTWFLVPLGVPDIGIIHAIGISMIASFLTSQYINNKDADKWGSIAFTTLVPFFALVFGAIAHAWM